MEKALEQALPKEVIEVQEVIAPPEPKGGFPWCGAGLVVAIVAIAVLGRKLLNK